MTAKRSALPDCAKAAHPGLILARWLEKAAGDDKDSSARNELRKAAVKAAAGVKPLYEKGYKLWKESFPAEPKLFKTANRVVVGLGNDNVLEAGIALNYIYGTPYIPGSALKGLAAHYCHSIWGEKDAGFKRGGEYHSAIFGTNASAGHLVFNDAWITPETLAGSLGLDIMTCHHMDYYGGAGKPPSDYDSPNPVHFISVSGTFAVFLACDAEGEEGRKWLGLAYNLLGEALSDWGAGGKTSSGYGRMSELK